MKVYIGVEKPATLNCCYDCTVLCSTYVTAGSCQVGMYLAETSVGREICRPCPDNSISISADSKECVCIRGYYRNTLEDVNVPCTSESI